MTQPHQTLWENCLKIFAENLAPDQFEAWFKPISSVSFEDNKLTLLVPSPFFHEQLEERYVRLLSKTLQTVYGPAVKLFYNFYQVGKEPTSKVTIASAKRSPAVSEKSQFPANPFAKDDVAEIDSQLNPTYTFENFCDSVSNRVARTIGEAVANDPKIKTFNPLFIFGAPGVGKTHLIQAIGIRIKEVTPSNRVLYVAARTFESQFTTAVNRGKINDFINFYQSIDTLIIDDIQELIGKQSTQNTFFYIFNHLILNQRQLILASDCPPSKMEGMEKRLISRFNMGVVAELEQPDYTLRLEVLKQKSSQDGVQLPSDVIEFIASNVTGSIRELEGMVLSLLAHATALGKDITLALAKKVFAHSLKTTKRTVNFDAICQTIATFYDVDPDMIFTKSRKREISDARQMVMYMAKRYAKMPLKTIGTRLGRTHATVIYAIHNIEQRLPLEKQLQTDITNIEKLLALNP